MFRIFHDCIHHFNKFGLKSSSLTSSPPPPQPWSQPCILACCKVKIPATVAAVHNNLLLIASSVHISHFTLSLFLIAIFTFVCMLLQFCHLFWQFIFFLISRFLFCNTERYIQYFYLFTILDRKYFITRSIGFKQHGVNTMFSPFMKVVSMHI